MTSRRALQDRIFDLEEELKHKDRLHKALLDGHDAITAQHHASDAAAGILGQQLNAADDVIRNAANLAEELAASTSSAYRKAGRRLAEILNGGPEQAGEAAS